MPDDSPGGRPPDVRGLRRTIVYLARLVLLAGVYYLAARLGLRYASIGESISLVWPPTGIALSVLVLLGYRYWPGVALGAFLANAGTSVPVAAAAGIAAGNTIEALLAAYLFRVAAGSSPQLEQPRTVRALVLAAAPLGALVSAVIGVGSLAAVGALTAPIPVALSVWWAGDLLGALVLAPVCLAWGTPRDVVNSRGILELAALCLVTVAAAEIVLGEPVRISLLRGLEYHYLLFPFVVWAGLRFGVRGASLLTFTVAVVAVWHTAHGGGPFVRDSSLETRFAVTLYLGALAVTGLVLAAAVRWERVQATEALKQSQERLRLALEAARMGIWFWSVEDNIVTWDRSLRQLFGLAPDERVSTYEDFLARVHPDDRDLVAASVRRALHEGGDSDYEFRIQLPGGEVRWIATRGEVGRDETGRARYMTGVCLDATPRRLTEDRLRRAQRMESVGRLAGGVAHETNNQMTVVLGAARLILGHAGLSDEVRGDVEYIRRAAERTATVTAQLLAYSRQQLMRPEVIELNDFVSLWEPVLRRIMGEDCLVSVQLAADVGCVRVDPGQLEQVLLNLALNARDAMAHGGRLSLESYRAELTPAYARLKPEAEIKPGPYAVLAMSDTGHGMDRTTAARIFEPFFTTKEPGQGTGLGLSTAYGIVKQSEGYLWVYSEPGHGSTFKIYLPCTTEPAAVAEEPPAVRLTVGAGERILVIEDDEAVREIASRALEEAGYDVVVAESGPAALELLQQTDRPVRLAVIDLVLPGMSGPEIALEVVVRAPGVRVIFTSGYPDSEIRRRGLLATPTTFIQKPFTPEALVRAVQQELDAGPAPATEVS
jgi:PAS domain S-box-containing protein